MGLHKLYKCVLLLCSLAAVLGCGAVEVSHIGTERILVEQGSNSDFVSAFSARTERADPLDSFKKYKGGYNITDKHYWTSVIYTGRYGYIIGTIWLVSGVFYACILLIRRSGLVKKQRKQKKDHPCSKRYCMWLMLLGIILTCFAIVASGIMLRGSSKFHSSVQSIKNIIVDTSEEASHTIYNVTQAVAAMGNVTEQYGGFEGFSYLNSTSQKLSNEASNIQRKAEKIMRLVSKGIKILVVVTILSVVFNLVALLAVLALRPLRLYRTIYLVIIICWILTFLFWIQFGLYLFLFKFSGDTCAGLDEYQLNPQNSTLISILPCSEELPANVALLDIRSGIHDTIDQVNEKISLVNNNLPDLEYVCNPFSSPPEYSYQPGNCSSNTIRIGDIPQILKKYTCSATDEGACSRGEFVSASDYTRVKVYTHSMQIILDGYPQMERLVDCQLLKDAFSKIHVQGCKPLKYNACLTWAAMAALSATMVAFVLILISELAHHDHKCHSSDGSVRPQLAFAEGDIETQMDSKEIVLDQSNSHSVS
ncbi:hypothetical protein Cni_G21530 [Canna indica]|uniref:Uncharacterized protein n=1 Tax=Canna indica TaxID=4628 RepID=A0AAQ3KPQ0_9LILI|nr:hypothetical protein Cni_G21530 [Canna indica]